MASNGWSLDRRKKNEFCGEASTIESPLFVKKEAHFHNLTTKTQQKDNECFPLNTMSVDFL